MYFLFAHKPIFLSVTLLIMQILCTLESSSEVEEKVLKFPSMEVLLGFSAQVQAASKKSLEKVSSLNNN